MYDIFHVEDNGMNYMQLFFTRLIIWDAKHINAQNGGLTILCEVQRGVSYTKGIPPKVCLSVKLEMPVSERLDFLPIIEDHGCLQLLGRRPVFEVTKHKLFMKNNAGPRIVEPSNALTSYRL